ncbi:hypothetical protein B566_EDAN018526 [Ephemera danica]|nr:hypothetical protein B566_EDAN018526 [Ephemera danica]
MNYLLEQAMAHPQGAPVATATATATAASAARWQALPAVGNAGAAFQPPTRCTVYGTLLNHRDALAALGEQVNAAPYKAPPQAPILYIKPRNTWEAVVWLPPFEVGTVIALGLNYADHVKELSKELTVTAKDEPLAFLKSRGALIGHRGQTRRPADVKFMHYECELAVVIGRSAKNVKRAEALQHVAGYCVANDYAIRDYLENYYRPNLRVKNRDTCTVLGPWLVDAADVPDPQHLANSRSRETPAT